MREGFEGLYEGDNNYGQPTPPADNDLVLIAARDSHSLAILPAPTSLVLGIMRVALVGWLRRRRTL